MSAWAAEIDLLSHEYDVLIIQSVGNIPPTQNLPGIGVKEHLAAGRDYPDYFSASASRIANPAQSLQALTIGSVAYGAFDGTEHRSFARKINDISAFSRSGFGLWDVVKPEVVEYGGDYLRTEGQTPDIVIPPVGSSCYPPLVRSTVYPPGPMKARDEVGTSFAAPKVAHIAAWLQRTLPNEPCLLYRALIVQSARWSGTMESLSLKEQGQIYKRIGYGIPDLDRATTNNDYRATFITHGITPIKALEGHVYRVSIPDRMRGSGTEYNILVEVTLSYSAIPRRTRRNPKHYLSNWVSWMSSKLGEDINHFLDRALKDQKNSNDGEGNVLQWKFHENSLWGNLKEYKRNPGTVQKDWAIVKSHELPKEFCIAVIGHKGWSQDPDSTANYTLVVSFEVLGKEIPIYEDLKIENQIEIQTENEELES
jgi:hypothetical protein